MAYAYGTVLGATTQAPPIIGELEAIFEALPDEDLLKALTGPRRRGRPGYQAKILWHSYIVRYVLGLPSVSALIRLLEDNPFIAEACGIESPDDIPSQPTFSRFFTKLSLWEYRRFVKQIMKEIVRECYRTLPGFGKRVAIDSTDIKAWANKAKKPATDKDAAWAVKSTSGNLKKFWLGYKAHLAVDAEYELPIALTVTPANVHDTRGATRVLRQARYATPKFHPDFVMADKGYSSDALRHHIHRQYRAEPIIKAQGGHKKALARETLEFKAIYNQRVAVERVFSRLKEHRSLNHLRGRGINKATVHCFLAVIVLQGQAVATGCRASVRKVA